MISLNPLPSNEPLAPGADLIAHLGASARPAIIHYGDDERTELSGRVAVNWATKTTHLLEAYGIAADDPLHLDIPVTWRALALTLGTAWAGLVPVEAPDDAAAILTDRPEAHMEQPGEIFATHCQDVDASIVDVDDEVLSHADQALLPVPDIIGQAETSAQPPRQVARQASGLVVAAHNLRLDTTIWWAIVDTWRRTQPVVLIDVERLDDEHVARIITTEHLG